MLIVATRHAVPNQPRLLVKDGEQQPVFPGSLLDNHGKRSCTNFISGYACNTVTVAVKVDAFCSCPDQHRGL